MVDNQNEKFLGPHEIAHLPKETGVYLFWGTREDEERRCVLYVGKANNLYSRIRQYFVEGQDTRPFVELIRKRTNQIQFFVVKTEGDALILENELIKKHRPPYNIVLKDDTRYISLRLDLKHLWPKIDIVRKIKRDGAVYLGPFSSAFKLRQTLDIMQKIFLLRTCSDHKMNNRSRPCIEYELKRCSAPCVKYISPENYRKSVDQAVLLLKGNSHELVKQLKGEMEALASAENFEGAAQKRNQWQALEGLVSRVDVVGQALVQAGADQDALGIARSDKFTVISMLFIRSGILLDKRTFEFEDLPLDDESAIKEFIRSYYSREVYIPHEILLPFRMDDVTSPEGSTCLYPRSEEKKAFVEMAASNARAELESRISRASRLDKTLKGLQSLFALEKFPETMDCMDISHHQGLETVASVVRFRGGLPHKDFYRRLKLSADQVDDFASMKEVVERRYKTLEDLPHLIVIDGGRGQLSSAVEILKSKGWDGAVDIVSLAKAREGEGIDPLNPQNRERVFRPGQKNPILLKENSAEELLLRYLRDEAHRFAITYHRLRKTKTMTASVLDDVPGMTPRMKAKLLKRFGSIEGILSANDIDILKEIPEKLMLSLKLSLGDSGPDHASE